MIIQDPVPTRVRSLIAIVGDAWEETLTDCEALRRAGFETIIFHGWFRASIDIQAAVSKHMEVCF